MERNRLIVRPPIENTEPYEAAREYWLKRLPTLPAAPELPLATNPASLTRAGFSRRDVRLEPTVWRSLKETSARLGLTPAGTLLAAYAEVLTIWSKKPRFTIRVTAFDRRSLHQQIDNVEGDFTAVSLLEVDYGGSEAFQARARRLHKQFRQDFEHREFSGVRVMQELAQAQGTGSAAIMPVGFTCCSKLGDSEAAKAEANGWGSSVYRISQTPQIYLDCSVQEQGEEVVIHWDAVDEVFPCGLLDDMLEAYRSLLGSLGSDSASWQNPPAEMARQLIPAAQRQLVAQVNATSAPVSDELLHTLFLRQFEKAPDQIALCTPRRRLTYAELHQWAATVEEVLLARDVRPNQLVAVMMEKGWEQVVAVLGILFSGAAYLPVDPELPAERQRHLIERGEARIVLTQSNIQPRLNVPSGVEVLTVDLLNPGNAQSSLRRRQRPEDLAYCMFTSGSTGLPKGVMIDHRGAVNTVLDMNQRFGVGAGDRVLAISRLNFDLSVYDNFGLLAAGGTIVMPSAERALDAAHWLELIALEKVTVWHSVPAFMRMLVEEAGSREGIGESVQLIMLGGDWIPTNLPAPTRRLFPHAKLVGMGGVTEASIWSILYPIEWVDPNWKSIPYGKPMRNQTMYVLTEAFAPRPVWIPGEIYIGGIGVAKGYWRDPEKTSARFVSDPTTGQRLYRTGDLGRYLPDGNIEFLGREDFQVKIRGYRIELGEIEAVLSGHDAVKDAVATVVGGKPGGQHLRMYVVPQTGKAVTMREVQGYLKERLPSYMVPSEYVLLDALPLSPNGKVDRKALFTYAPPQATRGRPCLEPRSEEEKQLLAIWEELLDTRPLGVQDDFFEVGGDSLLAVRLLCRIEQVCGKKIPTDVLFGGATIEHLAQALVPAQARKRSSPLVEVQRGNSDPPFFFCHGDFNGGFYCRKLVAQMGKELTFYGLAPHGLEGEKVPPTIEAMAADRIRKVLEYLPQGPYLLGGYSNGGIMAFEMARQMRQRGLRVDLVVVVDEPPTNVRFRGRRRLLAILAFLLRRGPEVQLEWFLRWRDSRLLARLRDFLSVWSHLRREQGWRAAAKFVLNKLVAVKKAQAAGEEIPAGAARPPAPEAALPPEISELARNYAACMRAVEGYVPRSYDGRIVFMRTARTASTFPADPSAGWSRVSKHVEVVTLPGDHESILKEHLGTLAERIAFCLRKATSPAPARDRVRAGVHEVDTLAVPSSH